MGGYLPAIVGVFFILGLIAAAYSSADSALTALTTSFLIDIKGIKNNSESDIRKQRIIIHFVMSAIIAVIIIVFRAVNSQSVISSLLKMAGYTYGPLLGMYAFGLICVRKVNDLYIPFIAIATPLIMFFLNYYSEKLFGGYVMGFELLVYNGLLTFIGMLLLSKSQKNRCNAH
jgi:Na+/proline symporter